MQKPSKKALSAIVTTMFVVACSNQNQVQNLPTKNDNKFEVKALPSGDPSVPKLTSLPTPPLMNPINNLNEVKNEEKLDFDTPPVIDSTNAIDGAITVIYKNNHKVRLDKKLKKVKSIASDLTEVSNILDKYKLMNSNDLGDEKQTDAEMDKMQSDFQKKHNVDIPHLKSIHYYQFPKGTDTVALCKELIKLPMVRMAYPTHKAVSTAVISTIGTTPNNETNPVPPSDNIFTQPESNWYWFNKHKVFKAWNYYGTTTLPKIAVIDVGFNEKSTEVNYSNGYYISNNGTTIQSPSLGNCPNNICITGNSGVGQHGTWVSNVAAAKKNNGIDSCGISPNSIILPIKEDGAVSSISKSIQIAANDSTVDVINISVAQPISGINVPLSYWSDINTQISYAVSTKNKPVAIAVGNTAENINMPTLFTLLPTLAVVVGGSMPSTITNKSKAWVDPSNPSFGSGYSSGTQNIQNIISLSASAYNIRLTGYDPVSKIEQLYMGSGTSLSTAMVSATLGMMRKINPSLSAEKLKDIIIYSSNLYKYDDGYNGVSSKFIGRDLMFSNANNGLVAGIRDLNTYNALVIAKNISNYNAIIRSYNIDDYVVSANSTTYNAFTPSNTVDTYGSDIIYGANSVNYGSYLNFAEFNMSGGCAYGYQIYRNAGTSFANYFDKIGGVSGISGVPTGCNPVNYNYNYPMAYLYN